MIDALVRELRERPPAIVAIGASSGALEALTALLPPLPASFPSPLVVVVHIPADRPSGLPAVLAVQCAVAVREAEDKMPFEPGTAYFAPPGYHLLVERHGAAALSGEDPVQYSRPSIDVLFDSVAQSYGPRGHEFLRLLSSREIRPLMGTSTGPGGVRHSGDDFFYGRAPLRKAAAARAR